MKLLPPLGLCSLIILVSEIGFSVSLGFIKDFIKGFLGGAIESEYWFVYKMAGICLVMPFFSKMIQALNKKQVINFIWLLIAFIGFFDMAVLLGYRLAVNSFPFLNWGLYVMLGCLLDRLEWTGKERVLACVFGAVSFAVSTMEAVLWPGVNWVLEDLSVTRIGICIMLFVLLKEAVTYVDKMEWSFYPVYWTFLGLPAVLRFMPAGGNPLVLSVWFVIIFVLLFSVCACIYLAMQKGWNRFVRCRYGK